MATKVSFLIQLKNQFSKQANAIRVAACSLNKKFVKLTKTINKSGASLKKIGGIARTTRDRLTNLSTKGVASLKKIGSTSTKIQSKISSFSTKSVTAVRKLGSSFANLDGKVRASNTKIMILGNKASQSARKISGLAGKLSGSFSNALAGANKKITNTSNKLVNLGKKAKAVGGSISDFGSTLFRRATLPLGVFSTLSLVMSARLESMAISFETMTGSAETGQKVLKDLIQFAATTPFQLPGIAKAAKTLLAFRLPIEKLLPTLRQLGDIAAGTDTPIQGIAKIFGKAREKTKLMTEELLQLSERGIPIIGLLSEKLEALGVPAAIASKQVFKLASESKISFLVMEAALRRTTEKGGIFFEQTIRQAKTLGGLFSTLKDNLSFTLGAFGDVIVSVFGLKDGMAELNNQLLIFPLRIKEFAKANPIFTKLIGIFFILLAVLGPMLFVLGNILKMTVALQVAAKFLGITIGAIISPFALFGVALALLLAAGVLIIHNWEQIIAGGKSLLEDLFGPLSAALKRFNILFGILIVTARILGLTLGIVLSPFIAMTGAIGLLITAMTLLITKWEQVKAGAKSLGNTIGNFLFGPVKKANDELKKLTDKKSLLLGGELQINSNQSSIQSSTTDINVNLVGPQKVIESIKTRSSGQVSGLNVGVNMVTVN